MIAAAVRPDNAGVHEDNKDWGSHRKIVFLPVVTTVANKGFMLLTPFCTMLFNLYIFFTMVPVNHVLVCYE